MRKLAILILYIILLAQLIKISDDAIADTSEAKGSAVYSTWEGLELDKCASAWLIKRFVSKEAQFRFFPKGSFIKEGIPFDTPDSELRRDYRMAAFGRVIKKYKLQDAVLEDINKIVWDVEVNTWEKKVTDESIGLNAIVQGLILTFQDEKECLEKSYIVFDALYAYLKEQRRIGGKE